MRELQTACILTITVKHGMSSSHANGTATQSAEAAMINPEKDNKNKGLKSSTTISGEVKTRIRDEEQVPRVRCEWDSGMAAKELTCFTIHSKDPDTGSSADCRISDSMPDPLMLLRGLTSVLGRYS